MHVAAGLAGTKPGQPVPSAIPRCLFLPALLAAVAGLQAAPVAPVARPATPDELALFQDAMKGAQQDPLHWAYTETMTVRDKLGRVRNETTVRHDPSRPYAEQHLPLRIDGKAPTEKKLKEYRQQGEAEAAKRARDATAAAGRAGDEPPRLWINGTSVIIDLAHPLVAEADAEQVVYEIPLRAGDQAFPVEKLQMRVRVLRAGAAITSATFRVVQSFRLKLVAKIKSGEIRMDFGRVHPDFGPVITTVTGNIGASVVFIPITATFTTTRTEWQRVKAFDERFNVKIAPLQFLGF